MEIQMCTAETSLGRLVVSLFVNSWCSSRQTLQDDFVVVTMSVLICGLWHCT